MSCSRAAIINISSILGSIEVAEAWEERQDICYRCSKVQPLGGWEEFGDHLLWDSLHHWPWHCQIMMVRRGICPPRLL